MSDLSDKALHEIHCGILPLANRFIVIDWNETRWIVPASVALDFAVRYYEEEGWYEECELEEDKTLSQPHGEELRGVVEVNADLEQTLRDLYWPKVMPFATKHGNAPEPDDKGWWFEENGGTIREMTDLPIERQIPLGLLWFDDAYKDLHGKGEST